MCWVYEHPGNLSMIRPLLPSSWQNFSEKKQSNCRTRNISHGESTASVGTLLWPEQPSFVLEISSVPQLEKFAFSTKFGDTIRILLLVPVPSGWRWWWRISPHLYRWFLIFMYWHNIMKPVLSDLYISVQKERGNFISYLPAFQISPKVREGWSKPVVYSM